MPPTVPGQLPPLSLWRAAQVLLDDPQLVQKFKETAEKAAKSSTGAPAAFLDRYQKELERSRYALSDAVPLVDALAAIAGQNGVIDSAEWKALGETFSPLLLQVAERARDVQPATAARAEPLIHGVSASTRAALARTSGNLVGLGEQPVLAALADRAAESRPLAGVRLFAVQHLFASTYGLFEAFEKAGINVQASQVFGKHYSTNAEVATALTARGWNVREDFSGFEAAVDAKGNLVGVVNPMLSALGEALKSAAAADPPERLLLLDEGGKLNRMVHDAFPELAHLCTIVEQTTNGMQHMEGVTLKAPAVSVAASQLKREVEGPLIGEDVAAGTLETLARIDPQLARGKTIGIVGYGAVGSATAKAFAARGFTVVVTDLDPSAEARAKADAATLTTGSITVRPRQEVLGSGIIIGCTGRGCMTLAETGLLVDGAILVNAASGDHEFPQVRTRASRMQGARQEPLAPGAIQPLIDRARAELADKAAGRSRAPVFSTSDASADGGIESLRVWQSGYGAFAGTFAFPGGGGELKLPVADDLTGALSNFFLRQGKRRFVVLRGGTPINMDRDIAPKAIQLTRAMLFAGCLQAVDEASPGWKTFDVDEQRRIEAHWQREQTPR